MKINELSKELGVKNKDLISYLNEAGFSKVTSHLQVASDDMVAMARQYFSKKTPAKTMSEVLEEVNVKKSLTKEPSPNKPQRKFTPDEQILCVSVTPWKLQMDSSDHSRLYVWENWGDEERVRYDDLLSWRKKEIITQPKILIQDADIVAQWSRDLAEAYKPFIGVDYPQDLFRLDDKAFEQLLRTGNRTVRTIIQVTAISMIRAENYPDIHKVKMIDEITGTCLMDFLS